MTNAEYEKASLQAVIGKRKLQAVDAKIAETERAMAVLHEQRREIVNQYDLNKNPVVDDSFDGDFRNIDFYEGAGE